MRHLVDWNSGWIDKGWTDKDLVGRLINWLGGHSCDG
jgi:hypothetical protein